MRSCTCCVCVCKLSPQPITHPDAIHSVLDPAPWGEGPRDGSSSCWQREQEKEHQQER